MLGIIFLCIFIVIILFLIYCAICGMVETIRMACVRWYVDVGIKGIDKSTLVDTYNSAAREMRRKNILSLKEY
jgi:hypothetical protein